MGGGALPWWRIDLRYVPDLFIEMLHHSLLGRQQGAANRCFTEGGNGVTEALILNGRRAESLGHFEHNRLVESSPFQADPGGHMKNVKLWYLKKSRVLKKCDSSPVYFIEIFSQVITG